MILASLLLCAAVQATPQAQPAAQPRFPVDPATGRAIGATEMAPESVKSALAEGRKMVIIDTRPAEAFEKESLPGAINIPLAQVEGRLAEFPKDLLLVFTWSTGRSSSQAAKIAEAAGYETAVFCPIRTWKEKGLATEPGKKK